MKEIEHFLVGLAEPEEKRPNVILTPADGQKFAALLSSLVGKPLGKVYSSESGMPPEKIKKAEFHRELRARKEHFVKDALKAITEVAHKLKNEDANEVEVLLQNAVEGDNPWNDFVYLHIQWS